MGRWTQQGQLKILARHFDKTVEIQMKDLDQFNPETVQFNPL